MARQRTAKGPSSPAWVRKHPRGAPAVVLLACFIGLTGPSPARGESAMLDLSRAVVVTPPARTGPERKAVELLVEVDRGANLDTLDVPLNDRLWLRDQFARLKSLDAEADRIRGIEAIIHRTDPGPGGFYDDMDNLRLQPHLVRARDYAADPDFRRSALVGFGSRAGWPLAWCQNAQTLHDAPLVMRYDGLDGKARYKVRVVYAGDSFRNLIRLGADEHPVHEWFKKPDPPVPVEFDMPEQATADGTLTLTWSQEPGKGANGRGCQVAEVWLIRK